MMPKFLLEEFIPYKLAVIAQNVSESFARIYRQSHGLSRAEWRILCHLSQLEAGGSLSVRDLGELVHLEKSKTSRAVTRLEAKGHVRKSAHGKDGRLVSIRLTKSGAALMEELAPKARAFQEELLAGLGGADQKEILEFLERFDNISQGGHQQK